MSIEFTEERVITDITVPAQITIDMKRIAFAGPWIGEFGWEILTWVPYLRKLSHEYGKMYISTFEGVEALYTGFHCPVEFVPHNDQRMGRSDNWMNVTADHVEHPEDVTDEIGRIKEYRIEGEYVRYGSPVVKDVGVLFHARGIEKGAYKNWPREKWEKLAEAFPEAKCIGSKGDLSVCKRVYNDYGLPQLIDVIASAQVVIGQSSGVMHLAAMCGTPIVTWGDCNNFGDTLENRYKETWNPFGTPVTWIGDTWDPEPEQILDALKPKGLPPIQVAQSIHEAVESGMYMIATARIGEKDGNEIVLTNCQGVDFPEHMLDRAEKQLTQNIKASISKARAERIPVSWR